MSKDPITLEQWAELAIKKQRQLESVLIIAHRQSEALFEIAYHYIDKKRFDSLSYDTQQILMAAREYVEKGHDLRPKWLRSAETTFRTIMDVQLSED